MTAARVGQWGYLFAQQRRFERAKATGVSTFSGLVDYMSRAEPADAGVRQPAPMQWKVGEPPLRRVAEEPGRHL